MLQPEHDDRKNGDHDESQLNDDEPGEIRVGNQYQDWEVEEDVDDVDQVNDDCWPDISAAAAEMHWLFAKAAWNIRVTCHVNGFALSSS